MLERLISCGARIIALSDIEDYSDICAVHKLSGFGHEAFSFFEFALTVQMLACKLSCSLGNNPDAPRALKKVTVTR